MNNIKTETEGTKTGLRDAATVVLARDSSEGNFEIYLMRRASKQAFMGGAYVFPGGVLDEEDCYPDLLRYAAGITPEKARTALQEDIPAEKAVGLYFCAIRETFEESGILLAYSSSGNVITFSGDEQSEKRFSGYRREIYDKKLTLAGLAEKENLIYALDIMIPYADWMTPEFETRRFNARFFLARVPAGQNPVHDAHEMTEAIWLSPLKALEKNGNGEIKLMPPTLKTIEELSGYKSIDMLFQAARGRRILPILPHAFSAGEEFGVMLPHDPEYNIPEYRQPHRPGETSRMVMRGGKWTCCRL